MKLQTHYYSGLPRSGKLGRTKEFLLVGKSQHFDLYQVIFRKWRTFFIVTIFKIKNFAKTFEGKSEKSILEQLEKLRSHTWGKVAALLLIVRWTYRIICYHSRMRKLIKKKKNGIKTYVRNLNPFFDISSSKSSLLHRYGSNANWLIFIGNIN